MLAGLARLSKSESGPSIHSEIFKWAIFLSGPRFRVLPVSFCNAETSQLGGFSSPASQPTASVFKGSIGNETSSVRLHVLHSKVRRSNPRSPGEIRARPILCLQVGHIGRSTVENELRISLHPAPTICFSKTAGLSGIRLLGRILCCCRATCLQRMAAHVQPRAGRRHRTAK